MSGMRPRTRAIAIVAIFFRSSCDIAGPFPNEPATINASTPVAMYVSMISSNMGTSIDPSSSNGVGTGMNIPLICMLRSFLGLRNGFTELARIRETTFLLTAGSLAFTDGPPRGVFLQ
jgi:hypothetical protein